MGYWGQIWLQMQKSLETPKSDARCGVWCSLKDIPQGSLEVWSRMKLPCMRKGKGFKVWKPEASQELKENRVKWAQAVQWAIITLGRAKGQSRRRHHHQVPRLWMEPEGEDYTQETKHHSWEVARGECQQSDWGFLHVWEYQRGARHLTVIPVDPGKHLHWQGEERLTYRRCWMGCQKVSLLQVRWVKNPGAPWTASGQEESHQESLPESWDQCNNQNVPNLCLWNCSKFVCWCECKSVVHVCAYGCTCVLKGTSGSLPCNSLTGLKVGCLAEPGAFGFFSPKLAANKAQWFSCLLPLRCWGCSHERLCLTGYMAVRAESGPWGFTEITLTTKSSLQSLRVLWKGLYFCHKKGYPFKCTQERAGLPLSSLTWSVCLWPVCLSSFCLFRL